MVKRLERVGVRDAYAAENLAVTFVRTLLRVHLPFFVVASVLLGAVPSTLATAEPAERELLFFWGVGCPHCEAAEPFIRTLARREPGLTVTSIEVHRDAAGRERFIGEMNRLGVTAAGIPTFVLGDRYVVGFTAGVTEERLRRLASDALAPAPGGDAAPSGEPPIIHVPVLGRLDVGQISLPAFTVIVGLVDGFNPCAMWVLLVLLSILVHVRSRRRLLLFGGLFVFVSGAVYFLFMVAWAALFRFAGLSQLLTMVLGVVIVGMGLINLKELIWFRQGVSLTISDRAKPALYRRMRSIAAASSLPAAIVGTVVLAVVVNIVELACTVGLPAAYTRILSLRQVSDPVRYAYLALYNISYVVPLGVIVLTFSVTRSRITLRERGAKILKAVSGVVLVFFGLLLLLAPGWLGGA